MSNYATYEMCLYFDIAWFIKISALNKAMGNEVSPGGKPYKPFPKKAAYEIILYLDNWFMTRIALNTFTHIKLC